MVTSVPPVTAVLSDQRARCPVSRALTALPPERPAVSAAPEGPCAPPRGPNSLPFAPPVRMLKSCSRSRRERTHNLLNAVRSGIYERFLPRSSVSCRDGPASAVSLGDLQQQHRCSQSVCLRALSLRKVLPLSGDHNPGRCAATSLFQNPDWSAHRYHMT